MEIVRKEDGERSMQSNDYLLMNSSIIYRCAMKFCNSELSKYDLGLTPLLILITIHEQEGISLTEIAYKGCFDKGTVTKVIQKFEEQGYVKATENEDNRREKKLYTTDKTKAMIGEIYLKRQTWWELLNKGLSSNEIADYEKTLEVIAKNARLYNEKPTADVKIFGLQKLTLLDFPGSLGATVFLGGCNFRCPFCHNSGLVFLPEDLVQIPKEDVLDYLEKRKGILDGVCVSGGEPLLQEGLEGFLREIKNLGYKVKIDTNGFMTDKLKYLIEEKLVDYVAMDIKNSPANYGKTIGLPNFDLKDIKRSVEYLLTDPVDYEFRTTVVEELHQASDFEAIGKWLKGAKHFYLQKFVDRDSVMEIGLHAPSAEKLQEYLRIIQKYLPNAELR